MVVFTIFLFWKHVMTYGSVEIVIVDYNFTPSLGIIHVDMVGIPDGLLAEFGHIHIPDGLLEEFRHRLNSLN